MPAIESIEEDVKPSEMTSPQKEIEAYLTTLQNASKSRFHDSVAELFFLENGGNMMDFPVWRKKPPRVFQEFLDSFALEHKPHEDLVTTAAEAPAETPLPVAKLHLSASLPVPTRTSTGQLGRPPQNAVMTPEQIVEKAKQEAFVMQRIAELQREGLWSEKRMPKVAEPVRHKSHWDYLLEEMAWLSADFVQERKWKKAAARKCARMVQKYFQDKAAAAVRAEKEEEQRMRKVASFIAKEIRTFWSNVQKFLEYKQQTRLEEKRKKALDQHLNFIVTETEKYSTWLAEGLTPANAIKEKEEPSSQERRESDGEFRPEEDSTDDEETIAREEEEDGQHHKSEKEIEELKRESEMPLEDLLNELPPGYLESMGQPAPQTPSEPSDEEFEIGSDVSAEDDEETIDQAEREAESDSGSELMELEAEKDMPLEQLMERYGQKRDQAAQQTEQMDEDSEGLTGESDYEVESETEKEATKSMDDGKDLGIESLLENVSGEDGAATSSKLSDAAALAESFQPKGNTLESTKVVAQVPFLLKHTLREYQHIGLDWMAAMYERKLNGILADEMGLGKTIQTIALLAWLACEKGIWGPHLVVVPTSVMLNWEMEFKKWCPAFKILTYYGSQKDRKQKRIGWTKPNAFHVCVTSYKLVLQDHQAFRRKRWKYLILDEAQNIKNFKSQRWQLLLNFQTQRRLLLTGTPLQNNLMELWSLMHFLMPDIFESHRDFREWFSNPVTGMIEGNAEYNESVIRKLHKVLRPFILRRLKSEVEKQMPRKYEHVVVCRLSKRQRYLYDDFMSRAKTKETLESGNLLSVINVLMQLRKVCNHPNLFEQRPIVSPFQMEGIVYKTASIVYGALDYDPFKHVDLSLYNLLLADLELTMTAFAAHRIRRFQAPTPLIQEIDSLPPPPPRCPRGKIRLHVRPSSSQHQVMPAGVGRGLTPRPAGAAPKPGTPMTPSTAGGVAAPLHPRLAAPAPTLTSAASAAASTGAATVARSIAALPQASADSSARTVQPISTVAGQMNSSVALTNNSIAGKLAQRTSTPSTPSGGAGSRVLTPRQNAASLAPHAIASTNSRPATTRDGLASSAVNSNSHVSTPALASMRSRTASEAVTQNGPEALNNGRRGSKFIHDRSVFKVSSVDEKRRQERRQRLEFLAKLNKRHCEACPIYGADLVESATVAGRPVSAEESSQPAELCWSRSGTCYANCLKAAKPVEGRRVWESLWTETETLRSMIRTPEAYVKELSDILRKFVVAIPPVSAPRICLHVSHPPPSKTWDEQVRCHRLASELSPRAAFLHPIVSGMMTQFPDARLIQYDCGKLQTLDPLLRQLKAGKHRALIFTQMTRMLDVLEAFLNYHGYIYLRLDGTTKVDQRQALMERFNADPRIFCFILSTRSGGIGINLTGADTVIFYDSDWNPTMDAQAQDRCHRIGQTRDVHIYRLISERTVEENILKKANQKRLLGDIAIEGGNFSAAAIKKSTIHDIFYVDAKESDASKRMADVISSGEDSEKVSTSTVETAAVQEISAPGATKAALGVFETALAAVEDDTDVAAARTVRAEAAADMAEFDETSPIAAEGEGEPEVSKAEAELQQLEEQLKPVERYAMRFMEEGASSWAAEQLRAAEAQIEEQKRAWEQRRLAALAEKESKELSEDEFLNDCADNPALSYSSKDAHDQMWIAMDGAEIMPIWAPPTPPTDDNDMYIDFSLAYLYEPQIMDPSRLPAVHIHKELKRTRKESTHVLPPDDGRRPPKIRKEETIYAPRSLFDRPSPALAKFRRDWKLQKVRGIVRPPPLGNLLPKVPAQPLRPVEEPENVPEWLVHEDWTLLQAVQNLLELPINLVVLTPAHTPNWDLVSDLVNSVSRTYRSPKQCRNRYISVILPREEGKVTVDTSPKKIKKAKSLVKLQQLPGSSKTSTRPMRTSQLFVADNNLSFTSTWHQKFEVLKSISNKRTPTNRSLLGYGSSSSGSSRGVVNPKHASVLHDAGISYDAPLNPVEVAALRAERIAQKQKSAAALTETPQQQQQPVQPQQQRVVAQTAKPPASPATSVTLPPASPIAARLTPIPVGSPATSVLTANLQSSSPAPAASALVLGSGNGQPTLVLQNAAIGGQQQGQQLLLQAPIRTQRPLTVASQASSGASATTVVSVAGLTAAQAQVLASAGLTLAGSSVTTTPASSAVKAAAVTVVQTTTTITTATTAKTLTQAQLQYLKQQQLMKQQQQRLALQDQQAKKLQLTGGIAAAAPKIVTTGAAGTTTAAATTLTTVQIPAALAQQQQQSPRAQLLKSGGQTIIRSGNPTEVAALLKRQQLQKAAAGVATSVQQPVATVHISNTAQLLAQAGLQVQTAPAAGGQTQVAALVKTVSSPANLGGAPSVTIPVSAIGMGLSQVKGLTAAGVKQGTPTQQQLRQIALQQQLLQQRKAQQGQQQLGTAPKTGQIAQSITLGAVKGNIVNIPAQQLVSTAGGSVQIVQPLAVASTSTGGAVTSISSTVTIQQQLQQVVRQVTAGNAQMLVSTASVSGGASTTATSTSLIAKAGQHQTVQARVIPVQQQALKQVLAGGQTRLGTAAGAPFLASAIASGKLRVQGGTPAEQQALLSKVSAALQSGQPVSLALKNPSVPTARIQSSSLVTTTTTVVTTVAATSTTANTVAAAAAEGAPLSSQAPSNDAE